ncbi:MAG: portal protein, partial [Candidatus Pacebacteria bacterium]|nr:portal protein [Candidatus Paceibacterota bacterium]
SFSRAGEITRDEIKFTKYVTKLRKRFSNLLYSLLRTQLLAKGIIDKGEWNIYKENINFIFEDDGYFTELKKLEMLTSRIDMLDTITSGEMIGRYYSVEWVRKNVLMQTEEDIDVLDKQMDKEREAQPSSGDEEGGSDEYY